MKKKMKTKFSKDAKSTQTTQRKLQNNCSSNLLDYKGVLYHTVIMSSSSQNTLCYISMIFSFHVNLYMFAGPDCFLQNEG